MNCLSLQLYGLGDEDRVVERKGPRKLVNRLINNGSTIVYSHPAKRWSIMGGIEAKKRIKRDQNLQNSPIIALAKLAMAGDRKTILAAELDDYLYQSIEFGILDALIRQWIIH